MNQQLSNAIALDQVGNLPAAMAGYQKVLSDEPDNVDALFLLGRAHCRKGEFERGAEFLRKAASRAPNYGQAHNLLGMALSHLGRKEDALASFERATAVDPANAMALANKADMLAELGRHAEAVAEYDKALAIDPRNVAAWCNRGNALQALDRNVEAVESFGKALVLDPKLVAAHFNMANALDRVERREEAVERYRRAIALKPDFAEAYINLASPLIALKRWQEAVECSDQAIKLRPNAVQAHCNRGLALLGLERHEESAASYNAALAIDADYARALMSKASLSYVLGRLDEARMTAEKLHQVDPHAVRSYLVLAETKNFTPDDPQIRAMEDLLEEGEALSAWDRIALRFALGAIYQKLGEHERSFRHYIEGNALKRRQPEFEYDENEWHGKLARIRAMFTPELMAGKSGHGNPSVQPIFIVGMPRSGTTLIEQILAGHPRVHSCGEIKHFSLSLFDLRGTDYPENVLTMPPEQIGELARVYLEKATASMPATAERFTDKMLGNLLNVGLIHLALPNARIILARRDPVDNCISCFTQNFAEGQRYTNDLRDLGRYYRALEQLAAHWRGLIPEEVMLGVQYEDVVADLETQARRIVAHCGLEWDEACLAFHKVERPVLTASAAQVRKPIYRSSVGRWRAYADQLQPLLEALGLPMPDGTRADTKDHRQDAMP
jgi:tetratricopeptide (TPR) repeat protein